MRDTLRLLLAASLLLTACATDGTRRAIRLEMFIYPVADRAAFERLRGLRTQLAAASFAGPGSLTPEAYQQRLKTLADEGDALEADLARRSARLRALTALPSPAEIAEAPSASSSPPATRAAATSSWARGSMACAAPWR